MLMGSYHSGRIRRMSRTHRTPTRRLALIFVVLGVMTPLAQAPEPALPPSVDLPPELARVLRDYEAAWSRKDAAALARLFTEDGYVMANGAAPVKGRAAVEKHYTGSGGPLFLRAFAYAAEGAVGYILGGFTSQQGAPDAGKFTLTLRKGGDGRWLIVSDMDSPNRRPQRPQ
jgi:ketosteroid isomerase-like protein